MRIPSSHGTNTTTNVIVHIGGFLAATAVGLVVATFEGGISKPREVDFLFHRTRLGFEEVVEDQFQS